MLIEGKGEDVKDDEVEGEEELEEEDPIKKKFKVTITKPNLINKEKM